MKSYSIALMIYGETGSGRNALVEEKYQELAGAFVSQGFQVQSVLYNDQSGDALYGELLRFDAVLVWVNPIEQGINRRKLDALLVQLANQGCMISTHPEVILKMGTKEVLYATRDMEWGGETNLYKRYEDFVAHFPQSLHQSGIKVLKQYRGNGGHGVYKVVRGPSGEEVIVVHAKNSTEAKTLRWPDFYQAFKPYFDNDGLLIEQAWNPNLVNGMVRCYVSGSKVAGFGYQEINALYQSPVSGAQHGVLPGKRYYFTPHCGLFTDLKRIMENSWIPQLQQRFAIVEERMPVIWDADFFINDPNSDSGIDKYTLCEINVSCVSPFPPSAVPFIVAAVRNRLSPAMKAKG